MHPKPFTYLRPESLDHAVELLAEHDDSVPIAGGHGLIPAMKKRKMTPKTLVDIGTLEALSGIERTESAVRIGALSTHTEVRTSSLLEDLSPLYPRTVEHITGGRQVHNFATIGGNIARAHPGYDYEATLRASKSLVVVHGPDGRARIPAADFFCGALETCLSSTQLVTAIEVPTDSPHKSGGYAKRKEPGSGNAIVGVATEICYETANRERLESVRVAVNGLQESAVRLTAVEETLTGTVPTHERLERAASVAGRSITQSNVLDNRKASAEYRLGLLGPYVKQSLQQAVR